MTCSATTLASRIPRLSSAETDWLKGLLILLVVADHSDYFRNDFADLFRPLTVHVVGFFLLNFHGSFFSATPAQRFVSERFVRYLWPFLIFFSLYALGAALVFSGQKSSLVTYLWGAIVGSFIATKEGGGGAFMWFLPALFGFALVARLSAMLRPAGLWIFVAGCSAFHVFATGLSETWRANVPFGLLVVFYLVPVVAGFFSLWSSRWWRQTMESNWGIGLVAVIAALAYAQLVSRKEFVEIGLLAGPSFAKPEMLLFNFVHMLAGLALLWSLARKLAARGKTLQAIGRNSLVIYLLHPMLLKLFSSAVVRYGVDFPSIALAVVSFIFAVGSAMVIAALLVHLPRPRSLLFPKSPSELCRAMGLGRT